MKIIVRSRELAIPIKLSLPTSLLKWNVIWKFIIRNTDPDEREELIQYRQIVSECLEVLRQYVRENGHFNLVEVENEDGDYVLVRL